MAPSIFVYEHKLSFSGHSEGKKRAKKNSRRRKEGKKSARLKMMPSSFRRIKFPTTTTRREKEEKKKASLSLRGFFWENYLLRPRHRMRRREQQKYEQQIGERENDFLAVKIPGNPANLIGMGMGCPGWWNPIFFPFGSLYSFTSHCRFKN
ncbi:hypothetical protein NPIL_74311 [Nephila pilipes]|uniref:Uncharacterized protein n=1 Tax=Nephila pilipes TaxID=299642 RepID=A0A8X6PVX3_NEPPI|nr:hypothetical protein NPIL_74311 [Nephila pilipes]